MKHYGPGRLKGTVHRKTDISIQKWPLETTESFDRSFVRNATRKANKPNDPFLYNQLPGFIQA